MKKITLLITLMIGSLGFSQNLITNGDFENGTTGWSKNAANVVTESGNSYNAANVTTQGNPWDVNLSYELPLTEGTTYQLTFDVFSDTNRTLIAGIGLNQDPWTSNTAIVNLTPNSQKIVLKFTANFGSPTSRIIFDMGAAVGFVGIDNVILEVSTTTCNNGIKDGDETGIDCGGSCAVCIISPTVAAPVPPRRNAADVVSIYSDAYTNIAFTNFDAGWCGGPATTEVTIAGNKTLQKKPGVVCQGIEFQTNKQNLSSFTNLHFDFYITDTDLTGDVFNLKLVNFGGGTSESSALEVNINGGTTPKLVANQWVSVDVPITALGGVIANQLARGDIAQIGITTAMVDHVWYDNIYLYKGTALGTTKFEKSSLKVYPNPASTSLNIEANNPIERVSVHNILGQEVLSKSPKTNNTTLDISNLQKGTYILRTTSEGKTETTKVLKK